MNRLACAVTALLMAAILPVLAQSPRIARVSPDTPEAVREHLRAQGFEVQDAGSESEAIVADAGESTNITVTGSSTGLLATAEAKALVQRAGSMDYTRTSQSYYRALEQERKADKTPVPAELFFLSVQLGNWARVGELLGRLSADDARNAYSQMLTGLAAKARGASNPFERYESVGRLASHSGSEDEMEAWYAMQRTMHMSSSSSQGGYGTFLEDDFFGVMAAAPGPWAERDLDALATLGRVALRDDAGRRRLAEKLKSAMGERSAGVDPTNASAQAARLLVAIGWLDLAEEYLPATPGDADKAGPERALMASQLHAVRGAARRDARELEQAWQLLASAAMQDAAPAVVVERILALVPSLPDEFVRRELPDLLQRRPALMPLLIAALAESTPAGGSNRGEEGEQAAERQARTLRTQALLMEGLARAGSEDGATPALFRGLVWNWMAAAETARATAERKLTEERRRIAMAAYGSRSYSYNQQQETVLPLSDVLASAPAEAVLERLPPGMAGDVCRLRFAVELLAFDAARALASLQLCCRMGGGDAAALAGHYLVAWVDDRVNALAAEDPEIARMNRQMQQYGSMRPAPPSAAGIPLTRAGQVRNIADFRALLTTLRTIAPELDPARVAWAFVKLHSGAEVFQIEDLEAVFGPAEEMQKSELRALLGAMRVGLARDWRDLAVQQKAGTKRTEKEVGAEVSQGYRAALELARRGLGVEGGEWPDAMLRGQLYFDAAEFEKDRDIPLVDYVNLRDAAFASYQAAIRAYTEQVPTLAPSDWTLEPFVAWFAVLLGASDLAALMPGRPRDDLGLQGLRTALTELPGHAAAVHRAQFGSSLTNWLGTVPPHMKQKLLVAGLQVVGDEPAADGARRALTHYENLLNEVRLQVTVDGSTAIGLGRPFGLQVVLEHTTQVAREAGGFGRYLMNEGRQMQAMYGGYLPQARRGPVDHRDNLEQNLRTAWGEQFEIRSITFHEPSVQPLAMARDGWQVTPLAYVVLHAKDAAVDRIPSVQIDLDFADRGSPVVLAALSPVIPVNAADKPATVARPCPGLELVLTLDSREARSGTVALEVAATGNGIIPDLEALCETALAGFEAEIKDSGFAVTGMTLEDGVALPLAARTWQLAYRRQAGAAPPSVFVFPRLKVDASAATVAYKRYVDADLEAVSPAQALAGITLPAAATGTALRAGSALAVAAGAILLGLVWIKRRARRPRPDAKGVPGLPADCTPFAVIAYLDQLNRDYPSRLGTTGAAAMRADIESIQEAFFKPNGVNGKPDLRAIAGRWREKVG